MGLIIKAGHLKEEKGLAFSDFINKYKLKFCAVLEKTDNLFLIKNSIGFDGASIIASQSTGDFWDGMCENLNELNIFSRDNRSLAPLLQLFSFSQRDDVESVSIIRLTPETIFMVCNQSFPRECVQDLIKVQDCAGKINLNSVNHLITRDSKVFKMEIDFQEAVESFTHSQIKDKSLEDGYNQAIYSEISNRFLCFFSRNISVNIEPYAIRALFIITREITQEHLINHIILNLRGVIGNYSELIKFTIKGMAQSTPDIKNFLQVE